MRVLFWPVHGGYADAFLRGDHDYLVPGAADSPVARRDNVTAVPLDRLAEESCDVAVLQRPQEFDLLSRHHRSATELPIVYLEHNTPGGPAVTTRHPLADHDDLLLVHVTHFNRQMWDCGSTATTVIPHGVPDPGYRYTGTIPRQAVVINEAGRRGRAVGADLLPDLAAVAPIDLFGIDCDRIAVDGVAAAGNLAPNALHSAMAQRRLYLHTCRWTSLGLSLIEAMYLGMPVVALAATEAPAAVPSTAGIVSCDPEVLGNGVEMLIKDPDRATAMGRAARRHAQDHFGLPAFLQRWDEVLTTAVRRHATAPVPVWS